MFLKSFLRIPPDPIALINVHRAVFGEHDHAAVILFIPADGIEDKLSVVRDPIMQRLAANDVFFVT